MDFYPKIYRAIFCQKFYIGLRAKIDIFSAILYKSHFWHGWILKKNIILFKASEIHGRN